MHLLALFNKGIKLRQPLQCQLIHQVNLMRLSQILVLEILDHHRKGCTKEQDLALGGAEGDQLFDYGLEFWRKEFVCLVHHHESALV